MNSTAVLPPKVQSVARPVIKVDSKSTKSATVALSQWMAIYDGSKVLGKDAVLQGIAAFREGPLKAARDNSVLTQSFINFFDTWSLQYEDLLSFSDENSEMDSRDNGDGVFDDGGKYTPDSLDDPFPFFRLNECLEDQSSDVSIGSLNPVTIGKPSIPITSTLESLSPLPVLITPKKSVSMSNGIRIVVDDTPTKLLSIGDLYRKGTTTYRQTFEELNTLFPVAMTGLARRQVKQIFEQLPHHLTLSKLSEEEIVLTSLPVKQAYEDFLLSRMLDLMLYADDLEEFMAGEIQHATLGGAYSIDLLARQARLLS